MLFTFRSTLTLGLASTAIFCAGAHAADIELPVDKLFIRDAVPDNPLRRKLAWRVKDAAVAIGAPGSSADPRCTVDGGSGSGGTIRVFSDGSAGSTQDTADIPLPCQNWHRIGTVANPKGYRYVDRKLKDGPCRLVQLKGGSHPRLKASCKGSNPIHPLDYDLTLGTDEGSVGVVLTLGDTRYCTASDDFRGRDGSDGRFFFARNSPGPASCPAPPPPCDCCAAGFTRLTFEPTTAGSEACGRLRRFHCSNQSGRTCSSDSDCRLGTCATQFNVCSDDSLASCNNDADCQGTCEEQTGSGLPRDLFCGFSYTGSGLPPVGGVASVHSLQMPPGPRSQLAVTACDSQTNELTLGPLTASETNSNLTCTQGRRCNNDNTPCGGDADCGTGICEDRCFSGVVTPVVLEGSLVPFSSCEITVVTEDVTGTAQCNNGQLDMDVHALARVFQTGDLLSSSKPPDVPGVQPCPLCERVCQGGATNGFPCTADTDCSGGSCSTSRQCLGGANDGGSCKPDMSDDLAHSLGAAFPTSHDCPPPTNTLQPTPLVVHSPLVAAPTTVEAVDMSPGARRVFCGFCRDLTFSGSECFDGDPDPNDGCPDPRSPAPVPCTSDDDCAPPYESCDQFKPGAFGSSAATRIELFGSSDGQCLADGQKHVATLGGFSCSAPTFNLQIDGASGLPGPTATLVPGKISLSP